MAFTCSRSECLHVGVSPQSDIESKPLGDDRFTSLVRRHYGYSNCI
ncbi:hypothetical protein EV668_0069 [Enterovirga rhinocerotis]|uniref:Uncharacterized protein n=1 Tax=Enterovirga rhinocerotis TaxID=1339210 RepID=A0A4R7CAA7_9HYPH|nr:hypothetical protein EV668_0069 [Enterovirga rhinocerotis]